MIEFLQDYRGVLTNEAFYQKGDTVELENEQQLVNRGVAMFVQSVDDFLTPDFDNMTTEELRQLARLEGIKGYGRMKRKTLIKRLIDGN